MVLSRQHKWLLFQEDRELAQFDREVQAVDSPIALWFDSIEAAGRIVLAVDRWRTFQRGDAYPVRGSHRVCREPSAHCEAEVSLFRSCSSRARSRSSAS